MTSPSHEKWLRILAILLLLGGLWTWAFVYYQIMNWVVVIAALLIANAARHHKKEVWMWIFVALAVVFNPWAPLYFSPIAWKLADIIAAVLFGISFTAIPLQKSTLT